MDNEFVPYLCGGILFSFLIELHYDTAKKLHEFDKKEPVITQPKIMENLIKTINSDYNYDSSTETFNKDVSRYRTCVYYGGNTIPFECDTTKTVFDYSVRGKYRDVLQRMTNFTTECFPTCTENAIRVFVKRTLILIRDDSSIEDNTPFFINEDGSSISKKYIFEKTEFNLQSFLIGIWHYIITKPTKNAEGRPTFEKLFSKSNGRKWTLNTSCLNPYTKEINVAWGKAFQKSLSEDIHECENKTEPPKTTRDEKLAVEIYYEGGLLHEEDKKAILSDSQSIINLNANSDISVDSNPKSTIYKLTTEYRFKTHFLSINEEIIRLYGKIGSLNISGTTSAERWLSRSNLNNMRFNLRATFTAWFRLTPYSENEYSANFLLIGGLD